MSEDPSREHMTSGNRKQELGLEADKWGTLEGRNSCVLKPAVPGDPGETGEAPELPANV